MRMLFRRKAVAPIAAILCLLSPTVGQAEWMAEAYLGWSQTQASNNSFTLDSSVVRPLSSSGASTPLGFRFGYWFRGFQWLGIAADISFFFPEFDDQGPPLLERIDSITISQLPVSGLVMLRYPFGKSDVFPNGRVQPYFALGPSIVFSSLSEFAGESVPSPAVLEDSSWTLGFDTRVGITLLFTDIWGGFIEYRYVQTKPSLRSETGGGTVTYEPTFDTNSVVLGFTRRF